MYKYYVVNNDFIVLHSGTESHQWCNG